MARLPKIPRGEGSFTWRNEAHTVMRYMKTFAIPKTTYKVRLSVDGATADECFKKMKEKERDAVKRYNVSLDNPRISLEDGIEEWLKREKMGRRKATTYDRNECTLRNQIKPYLFGKIESVEVTAEEIKKHLDFLQYEKQYSLSVLKKTYELLDQYFAYVYKGDLNSNPMNSVPRPEPTRDIGEITLEDAAQTAVLEDIVLNDEEIKKFREFVMQPPLAGSVGRTKYGSALYFIMMTCVRVGEACAVTWGDIDTGAKNMRINKAVSRVVDRSKSKAKTKVIMTSPKSAQSNRVVRLSDDAIEALEFYKQYCQFTDPNHFVLSTDSGNRVSEQHLFKCVKGVLKGAKINTPARDRVFGVHYLRHTGISYYLRHGIPVELVSKMAGHASIDITLKRYYHIIHDQQDQLLDMMNGIHR